MLGFGVFGIMVIEDGCIKCNLGVYLGFKDRLVMGGLVECWDGDGILWY